MNKFISGAKIRAIRKSKGLTHNDIFKKTGVSISTLSNLEREIKDPRIETLCLIAEALDVDVYEFINIPVKTIETNGKIERGSGRLNAVDAKLRTTNALDENKSARKELDRVYAVIESAVQENKYQVTTRLLYDYKEYILIKLLEDRFSYSVQGLDATISWNN